VLLSPEFKPSASVQTESGSDRHKSELSTHMPSCQAQPWEIIQLEQLSTLAARILLADDESRDADCGGQGIARMPVNRRFDRPNEGGHLKAALRGI